MAEGLLKEVLPNLPKWVSVPIIIVILLVTLWPKLYHAVLELSSLRRFFELEKQRLELLKLQYEIEAIKKTHQIGEIVSNLTLFEKSKTSPETPQKVTQISSMPASKRFLFGIVGALFPIVLNLFLNDFRVLSYELDVFVWLGFAARILVFITLGGIVSASASKQYATPFTCFLVGLSITLFLTLLITSQRT